MFIIMERGLPPSPISCIMFSIRSSILSMSSSDIPNCFIRSSTGLMCISRAQWRQYPSFFSLPSSIRWTKMMAGRFLQRSQTIVSLLTIPTPYKKGLNTLNTL